MRPATSVEETSETLVEAPLSSSIPGEVKNEDIERSSAELEQNLQSRLDHMVTEMQRMKKEMEKYQARTETAETEASQCASQLVIHG